jgi:hypothetical protein
MIGKLAPCFKKTWELNVMCSIFKPTYQARSYYCSVGAGNSLERNCHYSIEDDLNFVAEKTSHTGVGHVNLFERHDKLWINGRVRSMTLWLDRALLRRDMSHIDVTDTSSIAREDYTVHCLHLNS